MMVAALVIVGVVACTETDENIEQKAESTGVSFYAMLGDDQTRAYIDDSDGDKVWNTIWEQGDTLLADGTSATYTFVCTDPATGKFTCNDSAAEELIGNNVRIYSDSDVHPLNSRLGKRALNAWCQVDFVADAKIQLSSQTSFFRYTYNGDGDVTLKVELLLSNGSTANVFIDGEEPCNEITFSGIKGENFVPFWCGTSSDEGYTATLSYAINGQLCKTTTINNMSWGKVYNLGTLTDPAQENLAKIYLVPNNDWKQAEAWFVAHFFNSADGFADVKLTDENADGIYECSVPADMEKVLFCRMNPAYTEFGWNDETITDRVWNQTGDETIGVEPDNYYYITDWATGIWGDSEGYDVPALTLGVIGLGGNWDTDVDMTLEGDYYTLKNVTVGATDTFKIRAYDAWTENYGIASSLTADSVDINIDTMYTLVQDGKNMKVAAGTYDLYFNYTTKEFYAMTVGTTPDDLAIPQYKIYLYQYNNSWTNVNLYVWDSNDTKHMGDWPGATTTATETFNGYTYLVWTMPRAATGATLNAIINRITIYINIYKIRIFRNSIISSSVLIVLSISSGILYISTLSLTLKVFHSLDDGLME